MAGKPGFRANIITGNMSELTGTKMPTATLVAPATPAPKYGISGNPGFAPQTEPYLKPKATHQHYVPSPKDKPAPQGPVDGGWRAPKVAARDWEGSPEVRGGAREGYNTPTKGGMGFGKDGHAPTPGNYPWNRKDNDPAKPDNSPGPLSILTGAFTDHRILLAIAAVLVMYRLMQ